MQDRSRRSSGCRGFRLTGSRRGAAYLIAVVSLLVGLTLALAMMRATGGCFTAQKSRHNKQTVVNLAEAGLDYAYWRVHYKYQPLPYTTDLSLNGATIHIEATDDGSRGDGVQWRSTMVVRSTATLGKLTHSVRQVMLGPLPYEYRYFSGKDVADADPITGTGFGPGFRTNGLVNLGSLLNNIDSGVWASGAITAKGICTPKYAGVPPCVLPDVDCTYYAGAAGATYNSDIMLGSFSCSYSGLTVYVNGRASLGGWYQGVCTLVTTGDVTIRNDLYPWDNSSYLAVITKGRISTQFPCAYVQAVLYSRKPDGNGEIHYAGMVHQVGPAVGDKVTGDSPLVFDWDSRINLRVMRTLRLPGL